MYKNRKSKMLADGGIMQEGGTVDEVSGNDVPLGSLKEEVRDDVDAKLSPGEYVFPADVTRYYGIAKLEAMRKEAQDGLMKMEQGGRMGNAEQVSEEAVDSYDNDEEFSKSVDAAMSEHDSETGYNKGGVVRHYEKGGGVPYDPATNAAIYKRAPIKGFEMIPMEDDKGNRIFIPFINGQPQLAVPAGYSIRAAATDTTPTKGTTPTGPAAQQGDAGGGQDSAGDRDLGYSPTSELTSPGPVSFQGKVQQGLEDYGGLFFGLLPGASIANLASKAMLDSATISETAKQQSIISDNVSRFGPSYAGGGYGVEVDDGGFGVTSMTGAGIAANPMGIDPATAQGQRALIDSVISLSIDNNISPKAALDSILSDNDESTRDDTRSPIGNMGGSAPLGSGMRAADKASEGDVIVGAPITRSNISARPIDAEAIFTPFTGINQDLSANISDVNTGTGGKGSTNTGTSGGTPGTAESIDVGGALAGGGMEGVDFGGYSAEGYQ
jgi:hypothetical protein